MGSWPRREDRLEGLVNRMATDDRRVNLLV